MDHGDCCTDTSSETLCLALLVFSLLAEAQQMSITCCVVVNENDQSTMHFVTAKVSDTECGVLSCITFRLVGH